MGLLLLIVLCASGCDRLLGLQNIAALGDGGSGADGGGGDGSGSGDGGPTACAPTAAPSGMMLGTIQLEVAVTEQAAYDVYGASAKIFFESPIGGGTPVQIGSGDHPAVSRDGSEVYVASSGSVLRYSHSSGAVFGADGAVTELAGTHPGTVIQLANGDSAMVTASSTTFQEWRRPAGSATWSTFGSAFNPEGVGASIDYPSLSADGLSLVYVSLLKVGPRWLVKYVRRASVDADFAQPIGLSVQLLGNSNYLASPSFSDDCKHLYAIVGIDIGMYGFEKYTLQ